MAGEQGAVRVEHMPMDPGQVFDWQSLVKRGKSWADGLGLAMRDAIVIVPFAQHLKDARQAWTSAGGWMPRIETSRTLAAACGVAEGGGIALTFDRVTDRLTAMNLLREVPALVAMAKEHPHAFAIAASDVAGTAQDFACRAAAIRPEQRHEYWAACREVLSIDGDEPSLDQHLARVALEWAAMNSQPASDALFSLRPSAWIVVKAGGLDPVVATVLDACPDHRPCLVLDIDPQPDVYALGHAVRAPVAVAVCEDFEDEAQAVAAQVLHHVELDQTPIAVVATDRTMIRRVCALLKRCPVAVHDETGWKLSTTRAAATIVTLLKAASPQATSDEMLEWMKASTTPGTLIHRTTELVVAIEAAMRQHEWRTTQAVKPSMLEPVVSSFWEQTATALRPLAAIRCAPLGRWLAVLRTVMEATGDWQGLATSAAGQQIVRVLRLDDDASRTPQWEELSCSTTLTADEFAYFVADTLEEDALAATTRAASRAPVIVTSLAHVMLRNFAALVLPCADESRLCGPVQQHALLGEAVLEKLGLETAASRRKKLALAFAHALRMPNTTIFRRRQDGAEPLAASVLLQRLDHQLLEAGTALGVWQDRRRSAVLQRTPVARPAPSRPELLPQQLTARDIEALRDCPYKFHAMVQLGLRGQSELQNRLTKNAYGTWLRAVLVKFHRNRSTDPGSADEDLHGLLEEGKAQQEKLGLSSVDLIPYQPSFEAFARRYVAWVRAREAGGVQWLGNEIDIDLTMPAWQGVRLRVRVDRIDKKVNEGRTCLEAVSHKVVATDQLKQRAREGSEDTRQLVYAAVLEHLKHVHGCDEISGMYLSLDDRTGIQEIPHEDLRTSAQAFVAGLAADLSRIHDGAALRALGEGATCEHCEFRGVCRRDHWEPSRQD